MLSIRDQDLLIRKWYPDFKLVVDCGLFAIWEGPLTPLSQTYRIRIQYVPKRFYPRFTLAHGYEVVTVLDPLIGPDPRGTGEPPQHVYRLGYPDTHPRLCVHDPAKDEWGPDKSIADILIPMVIKWLIFREDWVDTGIWRGGGRHPEIPAEEREWKTTDLSPEDRVRRERSRNAAFHRLGRKKGVFGSYLWMAVEYAGYSPPRFSPRSSDVTQTDEASQTISTSSLEPRQAA